MECRVKPCRRIVRIKPLREIEFLFRSLRFANFTRRFAEITAEQSALRLQRRGCLESGPCFGELSAAHQAKSPAKPCGTERGVQFTRPVKGRLRREDIILIEQNKTAQCVSRSKSRR